VTPLPPAVRELFDGASTAHVATLMPCDTSLPEWGAGGPHPTQDHRGRDVEGYE
jgi:hypothetical protein